MTEFWKEINEKYPKALQSARLLLSTIDYPNDPDCGGIDNIRDLYDFFDERGIFIRVKWSTATHTEIRWRYILRLNNKSLYEKSGSTKYQIRTEAEKSGFMKGFEILNDRL